MRLSSNFVGLTRYPIYQAPTGSIAGPELCAAVSTAGAMGAMALTWTEPHLAIQHIEQVRSQTSSPFLVNFALAFPPVALQAALDAGAPVVSFSFGDPVQYLPMLRRAGAYCGVQVTNAAGARRFAEAGFDFLICQGTEAGGHVQANRSLRDTFPEVVEAAQGLPVIAAGGIGNGLQIAQALAMGAVGAMLGTRFVATQESRAHDVYKASLVNYAALDTTLTVCFDGGWQQAAHRVIRNDTLNKWEAAGSPVAGSRPGEGDTVGRYHDGDPIHRYSDTAPRREMIGDIEQMCCYAGTSVESISDLPGAAELVHRLWQECLSAT